MPTVIDQLSYLTYNYRRLIVFALSLLSCFLIIMKVKYNNKTNSSTSQPDTKQDAKSEIINLDHITKYYVPGKIVRIYDGDGAAPDCVQDLLIAFAAYQPSTISANELQSEAWISTCRLLIIPGGRDLPYCNDLHGQAVLNIIKFLHNGGAFIGTCAGAYFASSRVEFGIGTEIEVLGNRELQIFKGISKGPYFKDFNYKSDTEKWVKIQCSDTKIREVFNHGGGYFVSTENYPNTTILGRYSENEAAIIKVQFPNNGIALLSHVHFETPGCWPKWQEFIHQEMSLADRLADDRPVEGKDFYVV